MTFSLTGEEHRAGRTADGVPLTEDTTVSPVHAGFRYVEGGLEVVDEQSLNGVFVRIRSPRELRDGDWFRAGGQILRFHVVNAEDHYAAPDGTLHFVSPPRSGAFRLVHVLDGAKVGRSELGTGDEMVVGADGAGFAITGDPFLSARHARVFRNAAGGYSLEDLGSTNGTYARVSGPTKLVHGDLVYLGDSLLRVDIT